MHTGDSKIPTAVDTDRFLLIPADTCIYLLPKNTYSPLNYTHIYPHIHAIPTYTYITHTNRLVC